ncbi:MAG TPA: glycosyltransferase family 39 protein [Candidatus Binatia bacterium]
MQEKRATPLLRSAPFFAIAYFVVIFTLVSVSAFLQKSPTVDEPIHLFAGYSYLKFGDFRANPEHPPLAKLWAALPLLAYPIKDFRNYPQWERITDSQVAETAEAAHDAMFVDNEAEPLFFFAKLQMVAVAIVLGLFVYLWAARLFGREAGAVALAIFALDPNILAHSANIHTDVPFAAGFFIGTYFFWRFLREGGWRLSAVSVLCFGLAAATKYAAPGIFLAWLLLGIAWIFSRQESPAGALSRAQRSFRAAAVLFAAPLAAYAVVWAVYGFRYDAVPGGLHHFHFEWFMPREGSPLLGPALFALRHHVLPEAWLYGQLSVLATLRRPAYLLGQMSPVGFHAYFPVAFAVKTPLPTIMLAGAGLWLAARGWMKRIDAAFLILPPALYFLLAVATGINIGLRHILPVYPFLFVLIAGAAVRLWTSGRAWRAALAILAVWYVGTAVRMYPDYLAYFNEAAGGPKNGYKILNDSNLDWGQDLKGLKVWMQRHGVEKIRFVHFGYDDPEYYGIDASYLAGTWILFDPPATQSPGVSPYIAISPSLLYSPFIKGRQSQVEFVEQFRGREPLATIGHSIFIFKTEDAQAHAH